MGEHKSSYLLTYGAIYCRSDWSNESRPWTEYIQKPNRVNDIPPFCTTQEIHMCLLLRVEQNQNRFLNGVCYSVFTNECNARYNPNSTRRICCGLVVDLLYSLLYNKSTTNPSSGVWIYDGSVCLSVARLYCVNG